MRNIIISWLFCSALLLSGCGDDPAAQLERDSEKIVAQAITRKLNKQIEESYGNLSFLLEPQKIMLVSSGENRAANSSGSDSFKPLETITISRKYNAVKIAFSAVNVNCSKVRPRKDAHFPYQAKLTVSVDIFYEEYSDFSGVPLHAIVPVDYPKWHQRKQAEFVQAFYRKLPPAEFDYKIIAETPAADASTTRDTWNIDVVWHKKRRCWELAENDAADTINAPPPSWTGMKGRNALEQSLKSQGFVPYHGLNFQAGDLEIFKKMEQGLEYIDGKWQDPRVIAATESFRAALRRWDQSRKFSDLERLLKELNNLSGMEPFGDCAQLLAAGLLDAVKRMESKQDEESLEQLSRLIKAHTSLTAPEAEKIQAAIAEAQKNIEQRRREIAQQRLAQSREKTKHKLESLVKFRNVMQEFAPDKITADSFSHMEKLQQYAEEYSAIQNYLITLCIAYDRSDLINYRKYLSSPRFAGMFQRCLRCNGKGRIICARCKGSGICQICGGSGSKTIETFEPGHITTKQVRCTPHCTACPKNPTCGFCSGSGGVVLKAKAKKSLIDSYRKIIDELDQLIAGQQNELAR